MMRHEVVFTQLGYFFRGFVDSHLSHASQMQENSASEHILYKDIQRIHLPNYGKIVSCYDILDGDPSEL
jgi:hypothetical protein